MSNFVQQAKARAIQIEATRRGLDVPENLSAVVSSNLGEFDSFGALADGYRALGYSKPNVAALSRSQTALCEALQQ